MYNGTMTLANGVIVPGLGLGTWFIDDKYAAETVMRAAAVGYRHFDTAQAYHNEKGIGRGVRASGIPREEFFITSKVAAEHKSYESAAASIDATVKMLDIGYVDMMIIHSPQPWAEVNRSDNRYYDENAQVWKALEDALRDGKVRAIGVSNFLKKDVERLWASAEIKPMVNQVLTHISNTPIKLIDYCQEKGMVMEAYSPIAHGEAFKNEKIIRMAKKYGVSIPRLCIRYDLQLGMIVIPKAADPKHMRENADVDFVISDEDMETLKTMEQIKSYGDAGIYPVFGGKK